MSATPSGRSSSWLPRRVRGVETEYGLALSSTKAGGAPRRSGPDEAARLLFRPMTQASATTNVFLRNGGRPYPDVGPHP